MNRTYRFGSYTTRVFIKRQLPSVQDLLAERPDCKALLVCDTNTEHFAARIRGSAAVPLCILPAGEVHKSWEAAEAVLRKAHEAGLSRDSIFIGVGGGVVTDVCAFAASVYMRGSGLVLVSTTLLGMVDAVLGGKSGFDLYGVKNLVGSFYPAASVYMPAECLEGLPQKEWKSGMAEVIKSAVIGDEALLELLEDKAALLQDPRNSIMQQDSVLEMISRCTAVKGRIVEADPLETGSDRALLNLGHTFAHALESAAGLGRLTHGEAVAWGLARACELGTALQRTPYERARRIMNLLSLYGYEIRSPHPFGVDTEYLMRCMASDKKKNAKGLRFIVPEKTGTCLIQIEDDTFELVKATLEGEIPV